MRCTQYYIAIPDAFAAHGRMVPLSLCALSALAVAAQALTLTVASDGGNATSGMQYGIMFEDINHSGDGGIYAELIQNRAFQGSPVFPSNLTAWSSIGGASLSLKNLSQPLSSALPTSMNVAVADDSSGKVGFANRFVRHPRHSTVSTNIRQRMVGH